MGKPAPAAMPQPHANILTSALGRSRPVREGLYIAPKPATSVRHHGSPCTPARNFEVQGPKHRTAKVASFGCDAQTAVHHSNTFARRPPGLARGAATLGAARSRALCTKVWESDAGRGGLRAAIRALRPRWGSLAFGALRLASGCQRTLPVGSMEPVSESAGGLVAQGSGPTRLATEIVPDTFTDTTSRYSVECKSSELGVVFTRGTKLSSGVTSRLR
jgi:hypothetical protein